ncbi:MAG: prepilin-type N-terminal cleavage/methylation domain-containing protein [Gemmatimonadales bacterium]
MNRPPASAKTGGFTLVEVMVSMTLLSVGSLSLASMLVRATRLAGAASANSYQTAMVSAEVNRYDATPFELLIAGTTCTTIANPFQGTRCTTINSLSAKVKQVTVVVTPSGSPLLHPITTSFTRSISGNGNPLKTE